MKRDSLLAHCLARVALDRGFVQGDSVNWAAFKATPKATRVAGFIILWAIQSQENGDQVMTNDRVAERWGLPLRTVERYRAEFRELFPEFDSPDEIAGRLVARVGVEDLSRSGPLVQVAL